MSEPTAPPPPPGNPPPPPAGGPPPASPPPASGGGSVQPNTVMIVLAYLYILCIVPLLVEREDQEVQWHAKHGLVLLGADIVVGIVFMVLGMASAGIGCLLLPVQMLIHLALLVIRIIAIVKGVGGERFTVPVLSNLADSF